MAVDVDTWAHRVAVFVITEGAWKYRKYGGGIRKRQKRARAALRGLASGQN